MEKYEYRTVPLFFFGNKEEEFEAESNATLKELGAQGYELVNCVTYFKDTYSGGIKCMGIFKKKIT
jgi:hypothetical protein